MSIVGLLGGITQVGFCITWRKLSARCVVDVDSYCRMSQRREQNNCLNDVGEEKKECFGKRA